MPPLIFRKGLDLKDAVAGQLAASYHSSLVARITSPVNGWSSEAEHARLVSADGAVALEAVRQAVWSAPPIPLTDQVRLPADEAAALANCLRGLSAT